eukprot:10669600-Karenia_brevis.AAC.1
MNLWRAQRALKGWRKTTPVFQRLPLPWVCVTALAGWMVANSEPVSAVAMLLAFLCCLRPGEL